MTRYITFEKNYVYLIKMYVTVFVQMEENKVIEKRRRERQIGNHKLNLPFIHWTGHKPKDTVMRSSTGQIR